MYNPFDCVLLCPRMWEVLVTCSKLQLAWFVLMHRFSAVWRSAAYHNSWWWTGTNFIVIFRGEEETLVIKPVAPLHCEEPEKQLANTPLMSCVFIRSVDFSFFVNLMGISLNGICKAYDEERNSVRLFRRMRGLDPQMSLAEKQEFITSL